MRLEALLNRWRYGEDRERIEFLTSQLLQFLQTSTDSTNNATTSDARWDGSTCVLITYGDAVKTPNEASLVTLRTLLDHHFGALANTVHVLPFLKASSDGGFAVASHERLEEHLGSWEDLKALSQGRQLMADLVLNHVSAAHPWVQQFRQGQTPGIDCVLAPDPNDDWSQVVRPRSTNLFTAFQTQTGLRPVWTTFGPDQVDVNWDCDAVLLAYAALLNRMVAHGVGWLRLDAVGYVWKEAGSTCIHHHRAHLLVKLLRALLEGMDPQGVVVTETNVPERENLSYLTPGDEAHLAYNFPLPPLLLDAVLREKADLLNGWLQRWPSLPNATNLLNFSASHDGVGLRPLEGLMDQERLAQLLEQCELRGGLVSHRRLSDGRDQPYELNISWWAAMADAGRDPHHLQRERFLLSQLLVMALPGIPAFYLPTVLASGNDAATFRRSGHRRDLNRERFSAEALERQLMDPDSDASHNLQWLQHAMAVRAALQAFHPDAAMRCISERQSDRVILQRGCGPSSLWAVHNITAHRINLDLRTLANRSQWCDRLRDQADIPTLLTLNPFAVHWLQPC